MSKQYMTTEEENLKCRIRYLEEKLNSDKAYIDDLKKQLSGARGAVNDLRGELNKLKRLLSERSNKKPKLVTTEKE